MSWPATLVLVRHGESEGNIRSVEERAACEVSTHDYPLTPRGREQARITGEYLRRRFGTFDAYYTSYYRRSKETMGIMFPEAKQYEDSRLAEAQRGAWHVLTAAEMQRAMPWEVERKKREGLYHYRPPGGENQPDVELRIHSFLGTLARDYQGQRVIICGHGHWFILFQKLVHRFPIEEALRRYRAEPFENTSVTVYDGSGAASERPRLTLTDMNVVPWEGML